MRVLLVDDEPLALERVQALLLDSPEVQVVGSAADGDEAARMVAELRPDLVLLDIQMPRRSGTSLAKALLADPAVEVVFITAFDRFAAAAFDLDAVDFLLKPVDPQRLKLALARAQRRRRSPSLDAPASLDEEPPATEGPGAPREDGYASTLWVRRRGMMVRVEVGDIDWIEAAGDYVLIHTAARSHMMRTTMDRLQRRLDPSVMLRVSRSAFVRRSAVTRAENPGRGGLILVLGAETAVKVGHTYVGPVRQAFGLEPEPRSSKARGYGGHEDSV